MPILEGPGGARVRLAYCMNVHPGETLDEVEAALACAARVRERLGLARMGVGLWLTAAVAEKLTPDGPPFERFRGLLESSGLIAFTANAFPIGGFHATRVKEAVYRPDWLDPSEERYAFTRRVARALSALAVGESEVTISTLPIAWRRDVDDVKQARKAAALPFAAWARCADDFDPPARLCIEPEPGCVVETTDEAIGLFAEIHKAREVGEEWTIRSHLGVCVDCCHMAVMGEDPATSIRRLRAAGVPVGKVHLSSAVTGRIALLAQLVEPRYLHQVLCDDGRRSDDLELIARDPAWQAAHARCHFHVPIYAERIAGGLETTRGTLEAALDAALEGSEPAPDLEVETYTWSVLPESERPADLSEGIAREMAWVLARLAERGYRPC